MASAGDIRAYLLRNRQLSQLTRDHIDGEGHLARTLVNDPLAAPDLYRPLRLQAGDRLLLCSRGLYRPLQETHLARAGGRGDARQAVENLLAMAEKADGADNVVAIVAYLPGKEPALLPAFSTAELAGLALLILLALVQIVLLIQQLNG